MERSVIGVIGGSGLYKLDGLERVAEHQIHTPFGAPSDVVVEGRLHGTTLFFLPRHGRGHRFSPSEINYRANLWVLKRLGVTDIISVSAVGSMREDIRPGDMVLVDQFIDRTVSRPRTFFDRGVVAHVGFADPVSARVQSALRRACERVGVRHHVGGAYVCIEGPQFSTRAESLTFRTWPGVAVIGMTNLPEARLAREAELSYATLALATDYDCWHADHDAVSVDQVIAVLMANVQNACSIVAAVAADPPHGPCPARDALANAIMTAPAAMPADARARLGLFLDRYLPPVA
ncbi:MAG: S-methyl-5'-thioadenosine phosphorylase [Myxococcales bacterium]|nr:S-methyl-5'-thioadenosine phosphorylase [Myxococcales bacterium]